MGREESKEEAKKSNDSESSEEDTSEEEEEELEGKMPTHIRIEFSERSTGNKILYLGYRVARFFFITIWFYFAPFLAMFASYIIPYAFNHYGSGNS